MFNKRKFKANVLYDFDYYLLDFMIDGLREFADVTDSSPFGKKLEDWKAEVRNIADKLESAKQLSDEYKYKEFEAKLRESFDALVPIFGHLWI